MIKHLWSRLCVKISIKQRDTVDMMCILITVVLREAHLCTESTHVKKYYTCQTVDI